MQDPSAPASPAASPEALREAYASLHEAHISLRMGEQRLRILVSQIPAVLWTVDQDMIITSSRGAGLNALGLRPDELVGISLLKRLGTGEEVMPAIIAHRRALAGATSTYELEWLGRTFHTHVEPLRGDDGSVVGAIGLAHDITDRKRAEAALRDANEQLESRVRQRTAELERANEDLKRQIHERQRAETALQEAYASLRDSEAHFKDAAASNRRLLMELDHRVRNNIAGLMGLITAMRQRTRDVDAFADAIEARLKGMAHVHHMLANANFQSLDLESLIRTLLEASATLATCPGESQVDGPRVEISSRQSLPLSMILVEWFTNSCKYGAFSAPEGRIEVRWTVHTGDGQREPLIRLRWRESGGPAVVHPISPSLGTELVRSFAALELRGRCELTYPQSGADHLLEFPQG